MNANHGPLYDLAKMLGDIVFPDTDLSIARDFEERSMAGDIWHNMRLTPRAGHEFWLVCLYLGGKYRYIGVTERGADAARFADMAAKHFSKYRKRLVKDGVVFNFSAEQVAQDELDCPKAVMLLEAIEQNLLDNLVIETPGPETRVTRPGRTVKGDIAVLEVQILAALEDIKGGLQHIYNRLDALEKKVSTPPPGYVIQRQPYLNPPLYVPPELPDPKPYIGDPTEPRFICSGARPQAALDKCEGAD